MFPFAEVFPKDISSPCTPSRCLLTMPTTTMDCSTTDAGSRPELIAGMSSSDRLSRDVEEVHNFLRVHAAACSEAAHQQVMQAQCLQLVVKFQSSNIGMSEASHILEALDQGPWLADQKTNLRAAVAAVAMTGSTSTSQKTQVLLNPDQYMTASMWKYLEASTYSEQSKLHSYCLYLSKMGLGSPSEKTAQHCTAKFWLIV